MKKFLTALVTLSSAALLAVGGQAVHAADGDTGDDTTGPPVMSLK